MLPYERLQACVAAIRQKTDFVPRTALVLGSGLGGFGERLALEAAVDYKDIPGFPVSTLHGARPPGQVPLWLCGGGACGGHAGPRQGYAMEDVVLPIRVMGLLGAKRLVLTNAAGGIGPGLEAGDLMLLTGHIAAFVPSPLIGLNVEELGPRFPDMTEAYSPRLREKALAAARRLGIPLKEGVYLQTTGPGVYLQTTGPQYETPAEIRMFAALGANAVGMSTACEAIAARHMGLEVCGISCITNLAAGLSGKELSHQEVQGPAVPKPGVGAALHSGRIKRTPPELPGEFFTGAGGCAAESTGCPTPENRPPAGAGTAAGTATALALREAAPGRAPCPAATQPARQKAPAPQAGAAAKTAA